MDVSVLVGSSGVGLLLLSFILVLFKLLRADSRVYSLMNFAGALLAGYASLMIHYLPFVVLEGAWAAVALAGVVTSIVRARTN